MKKKMKQNSKIFIVFVFAIIVSAVLSGCGKQITEGEVVSKQYTPAHNQVIIVPMVHSNGQTSYTTFIPFIYHYADKWTVEIRDYVDGEEKRTTWRVTESVYDSVEIGMQFVYDKNMEPNNPEYTREKQ